MTEWLETLKLVTLGLSAGILSGLFGIGGGLVIVPALVLLFGYEIKLAVGTSLFVILLPTGLLGVWEYWKHGELKAAAGIWIALGVFGGAYFGALMAGAVSPATMKRLYALFLLAVAVYFMLSPQGTRRSRAELETKPVPVDMTNSTAGPQAVH